MFKSLQIIAIFCALSNNIKSQSSCQYALNQLYSYAGQCNQMYANYYNQIVYYNACGYYGYNCLYSLNSWYYNECIKVNQWYTSIVNQCMYTPSPGRGGNPAPRPDRRSEQEQEEIELEEIDDLADEIDPDKSTRIRIPDNPVGWRP